MAKVIILNAPPRSGKDTIQSLLVQQRNIAPGIFKRAMFQIAAAILGESNYQIFMEYYESDQKDSAHLSILAGMTCREFMIWISEDVIKPKFGKKHFGMLAAEHFDDLEEQGNGSVIVSDGGFPDEVEALIDAGHEVIIVRMHRVGFDFSKDSRDYIHLSPQYREQASEYDIRLIDGEPQEAVDMICQLCQIDCDELGEEIPW